MRLASCIAAVLTACHVGVTTRADSPAAPSADAPTVIVAVSAPGEEEYGKSFAEWATNWEKTCHQAGARLVTVGLQTNSAVGDRDLLEQALREEPKGGPAELWLVLLGHGTFDGKEAKFNLRGPDLSASDLAAWLKPFHRPLAIINTSASSGPFLNRLSGEGRVVVTATRSGHEQSFARFGQYFSEAIGDPQADLDKDGQTSLLEAYLTAARGVAGFYDSEGRLATEHALLDDNGDGLGTPPDWFRGIRAVKKARDGAALDGLRAHQFHLVRSEAEQRLPAAVRARRDELELAIARLRETKPNLAEEEYYRRLEALLIQMAHLYEEGKLPAHAP
jgi:hypothetical protein